MEIKPFRGKHHAENLAQAIVNAEKKEIHDEIERLEKDFLNSEAGRVYDESRVSADRIRAYSEKQFTDIFGESA